MVSTSFMVDTSSHPRAQLHRCVERSAYFRSAILGWSESREETEGDGTIGGGSRS